MARTKATERDLPPLGGETYAGTLTGMPIHRPDKRGRGRPRDHVNPTARAVHARLRRGHAMGLLFEHAIGTDLQGAHPSLGGEPGARHEEADH